jgi:hypothetical protein
MGQSSLGVFMNQHESDLHYCNECGSEFVVQEIETVEEVTFCPYCGHELYDLDEDEDDEDSSWN